MSCEATPIKKDVSALAEDDSDEIDDSEVGVASYFLEYHKKKEEGLQDEEGAGLQNDAGINGCGKRMCVSCIFIYRCNHTPGSSSVFHRHH